jgi:hypothetical protein
VLPIVVCRGVAAVNWEVKRGTGEVLIAGLAIAILSEVQRRTHD